jgi:hypothetical protein
MLNSKKEMLQERRDFKLVAFPHFSFLDRQWALLSGHLKKEI